MRAAGVLITFRHKCNSKLRCIKKLSPASTAVVFWLMTRLWKLKLTTKVKKLFCNFSEKLILNTLRVSQIEIFYPKKSANFLPDFGGFFFALKVNLNQYFRDWINFEDFFSRKRLIYRCKKSFRFVVVLVQLKINKNEK